MLRKRMRVPAEILKDGKGLTKRSSPFFIVRSRPNHLSHDRFAVVVSIKTSPKATERHTLKRRITAALTAPLTTPLLEKAGGGQEGANRDIIVSVLPAARNLGRKELLLELGKLLKN